MALVLCTWSGFQHFASSAAWKCGSRTMEPVARVSNRAHYGHTVYGLVRSNPYCVACTRSSWFLSCQGGNYSVELDARRNGHAIATQNWGKDGWRVLAKTKLLRTLTIRPPSTPWIPLSTDFRSQRKVRSSRKRKNNAHTKRILVTPVFSPPNAKKKPSTALGKPQEPLYTLEKWSTQRQRTTEAARGIISHPTLRQAGRSADSRHHGSGVSR